MKERIYLTVKKTLNYIKTKGKTGEKEMKSQKYVGAKAVNSDVFINKITD